MEERIHPAQDAAVVVHGADALPARPDPAPAGRGAAARFPAWDLLPPGFAINPRRIVRGG